MDLRGVLVIEDQCREGSEQWSVPAAEHVANRPIALHVLDALEHAGVRQVIVASSTRSAPMVRECLSDASRSAQSALQFVHQAAPLDVASALRLVAPIVEDAPCIVHAAGGLTAEPLAPLVDDLRSGPDAVLMVHHAALPDQRLSRSAQSLLRLAELDPQRSTLGMAGVWGFGPRGLRSVVAVCDTSDDRTTPVDGQPGRATPLDVAALAARIAFAGGTLHVRVVDVWRAYRGEASELLDLNHLVLDNIESDLPHGDQASNRIEGRVRIHDSASVQGSVIVGPVVIAADAQVRDAYIGPYTAIGRGAVIEGAEIERSIISEGAKVSHVGPRLTASIVGRDARVFRDFSLPRAMRLRVADGAEVGLC